MDEIIVVSRREDPTTQEVADAAGGVRSVVVDAPGVLTAMRAGARCAGGDYIGFVDDDAEAHQDWLERVMAHFADPSVGAVGGRDIVDPEPRVRLQGDVGRITRFGKLVANHHLGAGPARDVDVLKGANMAFRRAAVAGHGFDTRLSGLGAQPHSELSICLPLRKRGLRLVYDPAIVVHHHPASRPA